MTRTPGAERLHDMPAPEGEVRKKEVLRRDEAAEHAAQERYAHFVEDELQDRSREYQVGDTVMRLNRDGETERWTVVNDDKDTIAIERNGRTQFRTREELALQERAAGLSAEIAPAWDSVARTLSLRSNFDQLHAFAEEYKADIIEMAALAASAEENLDPARALMEAFDRLQIENNGMNWDDLDRRLEWTYTLNAYQADAEFGDTTESFDRYGAQRPGAEATGALPSKMPHKAEQTASVVSHPAATAEFLAQVKEAELTVAPIAVETARGEVNPLAAMEVASADGKMMEDDELDREIERVSTLLSRHVGVSDADKQVDWLAANELMQRRYALLQEQQLRRTRGEKLNEVRSLLDEIRNHGEAAKSKAKEEALTRDLAALKKARARRDTHDTQNDEWEIDDVAAWRLEQRILKASGDTDALKPERYSQLYATASAMLDRGEMRKDEAAALIADIRSRPYFSARELDGLAALEARYLAAPVQDNEPTVVEQRVAGYDNEVTENAPATPRRKAAEKKPRSLAEELVAQQTVPLPEKRVVPVDRRKRAEKKVFTESERAFFDNETLAAYNEPYRRVSAAFGGPKEFNDLLTELERENIFRLKKEQLMSIERMSNTEIDILVERIANAVKRLRTKQGQPTLEQVASEIHEDAYSRIADAFGGEEEFARLYAELQHERLAPFAWDELDSQPERNAIQKIAEAVRALHERRETKGNERTFEVIAENLSGDVPTFLRHYKELEAAGLAPYTLDELKTLEARTAKRGALARAAERIGRFVPGANIVDRHVNAIAKAFEKLARQGQRQSDTYSGRRGGRSRLN